MPNLPPKSATPPSEVSRLRELQRQFATGIMRPLTPEQTMHPEWADGSPSAEAVAGFIKSNNRLSSIERLEIYNRQYWYRLIDCFYEDFPGLRTLLGDRVFSALTEAYLTRYRSRSFTLRDLGQDLEKFLVDEPKWTEKHAKLARDIVRLEWAQIVAFDGEALPPLEVDELLGEDPATLKLSLQPHLTLLSCDYPSTRSCSPRGGATSRRAAPAMPWRNGCARRRRRKSRARARNRPSSPFTATVIPSITSGLSPRRLPCSRHCAPAAR